MTLPPALVSSKSNEWATPQDLFDELNKEFDFTLDPCSRNGNHKCANYFTQKENGLLQSWNKNSVFMNPPYGGQTGFWIRKAYEESIRGATVVCLIVSATDRSYWHDFIFPHAAQIRFLRGRLKFGDSKLSAPFASAIIVFDGRKKYSHKFVAIDRRDDRK